MSDAQLVRLQPTDAARLQLLLDRCSDYYELHEGCATPADAGVYELSAPPPAIAAELYVVGLQTPSGALDAMIQILPNHPVPNIWWIGLLVVAPDVRSRGLGRVLLQYMLETAATAGATEMQLAVSVKNPRAQKFWSEAGFRETGRVCNVIARNGHVDSVRIMSRGVGGGGGGGGRRETLAGGPIGVGASTYTMHRG